MRIRKLMITIFILILVTAVYAYTQLTPNPGHTAEEVYIHIDGVSMTLQEAIDIGLFDCELNIGIFSNNITLGHNVNKIKTNIGGNIKDFQQALSDKSLFLVSPGTSSASVTGIASGHSSSDILVRISSQEKTLQKAINDGDFFCGYLHTSGYGHEWMSPSLEKSRDAAMEACKRYYSDNPGQCGWLCSSVACYVGYVVNCHRGGPGWSGFTVCDRTWEIQQANAGNSRIWIYSATGWCGWYVGATGNPYNRCASPLNNWK